jgi:hypothetical protein
MNKYGFQHNDLHMENILYDNNPNESKIIYKIYTTPGPSPIPDPEPDTSSIMNSEKETSESSHINSKLSNKLYNTHLKDTIDITIDVKKYGKILLFDWDRGTYVNLGKNEYLDFGGDNISLCRIEGECNYINNWFDLYHIMKQLKTLVFSIGTSKIKTEFIEFFKRCIENEAIIPTSTILGNLCYPDPIKSNKCTVNNKKNPYGIKTPEEILVNELKIGGFFNVLITSI